MEEYLNTLDILTESAFNEYELRMKRLFIEHEINVANIEAKIIMENGTEEDSKMLYLAEAEDNKEKKQGIVASLINAIRAFFRSIKEKIFGVKVDPNSIPDKGVTVSKDPKGVIEENKGLMGIFQKVLNGDKSALKKVGTVAVAGTGAFLLGKNVIAPTLKDLKSLADIEFPEDAANNLNLNEEEASEFRKLFNRIKGTVTDAAHIAQQIGKIGSDEYEEVKAARKGEEARNAAQRKEEKELTKQKKKEQKERNKSFKRALANQELAKTMEVSAEKLNANIREWNSIKSDLASAYEQLRKEVNAVLNSGTGTKLKAFFSKNADAKAKIARYHKLMSKHQLEGKERDEFMRLGDEIGSEYQEFKRKHVLLGDMYGKIDKLNDRITEAQDIYHKLKSDISEEDANSYLGIIKAKGFSKDIHEDAFISSIKADINKVKEVKESAITDFIELL